ncbi:MAG: DNA (cytosine-5-)-methyltransferase [Chloroflexi bacterium]|nr:DNA (cytosine-5-)-methyltransferase [Chloroflexota bacterium]
MPRFVDLFAGLGGFHLALKSLGFECVFASEIDEVLREVYSKNHGLVPFGDIRKVDIEQIPNHDILCAGFPCQPFSKAGRQEGFGCPQWGDLFGYVKSILSCHRPPFLLLENVPNLKRHDHGNTWKHITNVLEGLGYVLTDRLLSPHSFGIPQIRERLFIVGSRHGLDHFDWPVESDSIDTSIHTILDDDPSGARIISPTLERALQVWQEFLDLFPKNEQLPSFPIWTMEFGATYPFEDTTPFALSLDELQQYRGSHGRYLGSLPETEIFDMLPAYSRRQQQLFPKWKVKYIQQNRDLYARHSSWVEEWLPEIRDFPPSLQKFEWNCKGEQRSVWDYIIQVRASGIRVKRPTTAPSLVSMTSTQTPIIGWQKRYMTMKECLKLQSMDALKHLPRSQGSQIRAIGNAVNVQVVRRIASALLGSY